MLALAHVSTASFVLAGLGATVGVISLVTSTNTGDDVHAFVAPGWAGVDGLLLERDGAAETQARPRRAGRVHGVGCAI